jgi:DNA-binding XRE family transcriptional regulator
LKKISMRAARTDARISADDMTKMLGVGRNRYLDWENGRKPIPEDKFLVFCKTCGFQPKDISAKVAIVRSV